MKRHATIGFRDPPHARSEFEFALLTRFLFALRFLQTMKAGEELLW